MGGKMVVQVVGASAYVMPYMVAVCTALGALLVTAQLHACLVQVHQGPWMQVGSLQLLNAGLRHQFNSNLEHIHVGEDCV